MLLANVIFPAPMVAYLVSLIIPLSAVLALATEFAVFVYFQRGVMSKWRLLGIVVGVNLFSWFCGIVLSGIVPELIPRLAGDAAVYNIIAVVGLFWACLLSFALEYGALRLLRRWLPLKRLALCVGVANVASYCVIAVVVAVHIIFRLWHAGLLPAITRHASP
jgi:hypothetical protein